VRTKSRILALHATFVDHVCIYCGHNEPAALMWIPKWQTIKDAYLRHGRNSKKRLEAIELTQGADVVCQNCQTYFETQDVLGEDRDPRRPTLYLYRVGVQ
tara:strand:+ start:480 stop:779 length:300 start_codon:yes stop_codon:yes gene_type:complete